MRNVRHLTVTVEASPRQWREDALCRQVDPELFHPDKGGNARALVRAAKKVCAQCPVRAQCLQAALDLADEIGTGPVTGVWGGTSEKERDAIRRAYRARTVAA